MSVTFLSEQFILKMWSLYDFYLLLETDNMARRVGQRAHYSRSHGVLYRQFKYTNVLDCCEINNIIIKYKWLVAKYIIIII